MSIKNKKGLRKDHCQKKKKFPLGNSSVNVTKSVGNYRLVTITEEILNGKLHFCAVDFWRNFKFNFAVI